MAHFKFGNKIVTNQKKAKYLEVAATALELKETVNGEGSRQQGLAG